ncbi:hypothetical protein 13VV501A_gene0049 [Vibrio phage 13VV501A]|nr:hypothetical protein 13VV501A_gene0049 [Vibrio phage 13VV501A]
MTFYDAATIWVLLGVITYVDHVVYMWDVSSENMRKHMTELSGFVSIVLHFPVVFAFTLLLRYRVWRAFRQFLKENPSL